MIDLKAWVAKPEDHTNDCAVAVLDVITCARLTLEIEGAGMKAEHRAAAAGKALELVTALVELMIDGTEALEQETKRWLRQEPEGEA